MSTMPSTPSKSFKDKLAERPQRKLLALDGGGIRGTISLEFLEDIEAVLRPPGDTNFVLADYFDYIAGTSTGAIIATCLSTGMSVAQVKDFYSRSGAEMFDKAHIWERGHYKFRDEKLAAMLQQILGKDTLFGDEKLRTLLMIVLRNATTDSPWPLSNNPRGIFNQPGIGNNLEFPLWQLVRASTAAPTYFPPEEITVGTDENKKRTFLFVDGGVTMFNDPAFQLFLMATVDRYNLCWPAGEERMLIVSVGTGTSTGAKMNLRPDEMHLLYNAGQIPSALMAAAMHEQDFLCRTFGRCLAGDPLDLEVGDMIGHGIPTAQKLFTYVRYNVELSAQGLADLGLGGINPEHVQQMDSVAHIGEMQQVGCAAAARKVNASHFASFPHQVVSALPQGV